MVLTTKIRKANNLVDAEFNFKIKKDSDPHTQAYMVSGAMIHPTILDNLHKAGCNTAIVYIRAESVWAYNSDEDHYYSCSMK